MLGWQARSAVVVGWSAFLGRWVVFLCAFLWTSSAWAISVQDVPNPRPQGGWVSDNANMIDASAEDRLNQMIDAIQRERGVEIAVVTVDAVDTATPKDFATALFNHWGIGAADSNNGLLVLMVQGERRLEMETGYGTEAVLTDGWLKDMQLRVMIPEFKAGNFGSGLEAGVTECIARIRRYPDGLPAGSDPDLATSPGSRSEPPWMLLLYLGVCGTLFAGIGVWTYRKRRTCPTCKTRMTMLSEEEDDAELDEGEQTEERIGSVDYQFFYCTTCDFNRLIVNKKWFTGYSNCTSCGYRASATNSHTVRSATYSSTGLERVTTECSHCDARSSHNRVIPMLVESSSSSGSSSYGGSSGGSFGGGSSGGGGAGSSW